MNILLTGGLGFIGSHKVVELVNSPQDLTPNDTNSFVPLNKIFKCFLLLVLHIMH